MTEAYIFPGQGSQVPGMGKELYESSPLAWELMERANEILGFRLTDVMFGGTAEELRATSVTQPAIFLHSYVLSQCHPALAGKAPAMAAGHSLGEFSALAAVGALAFEDALRLVSIRATEMQKCCEKVPGGMAAIISLSDEAVEQICVGCSGTVVPANYNSPGQIVISGEKEAVEEACRMAKAAGARRALPLPVGGAFHSPLMEPARAELGKAIAAVTVREPSCPIYQNVTAESVTDPAVIKSNLLKQLTAPVRWTASVQRMVRDGASGFTEIGPGSVLQNLIRRILPGTEIPIAGIE